MKHWQFLVLAQNRISIMADAWLIIFQWITQWNQMIYHSANKQMCEICIDSFQWIVYFTLLIDMLLKSDQDTYVHLKLVTSCFCCNLCSFAAATVKLVLPFLRCYIKSSQNYTIINRPNKVFLSFQLIYNQNISQHWARIFAFKGD